MKLTRCGILDILGGKNADARFFAVSDFQTTVYVDAVKRAPFKEFCDHGHGEARMEVENIR